MDVGDFIAVLALFVSVFAALVPWWAKGRAYPTVRLEEYSIIRGGDQSSRRWQERRVVIENAGPSNAYDVRLALTPSEEAVLASGGQLTLGRVVDGQEIHLPLNLSIEQVPPVSAVVRWKDGRLVRRQRSETFHLTPQEQLF